MLRELQVAGSLGEKLAKKKLKNSEGAVLKGNF